MEIRFRDCEYNDLNFILKLKEMCMKWYTEKIYGWDTNAQIKKTQREIEKFKDTMKIIVIDNKDIGVTNFFEDEGKYHVGLIIVHPNYQKKGIATSIINNYIDIARKDNKDILINTYKYNPAKKLYEKLGFKQYNEDDTHVYLKITF